MKTLLKTISIVAIFFLSGCGTDFLEDPAGSCVTCQTQVSTTVVACADGEGNITVTTTNASGNEVSAVTSENTLNDFQVSQEGSGATCN